MGRRTHLVVLFVTISLCGCAHIRSKPSSSGLVLLSISRSDITHLGSRLGLTNAVCLSPGRDAKGESVLLSFLSTHGWINSCLVRVSADGVHAGPWHASRERDIPDDQRLNLQNPPMGGWSAPEIDGLPSNVEIESVSGDWAVFREHNRPPWLAKIAAPTVSLLDLPESASVIGIWSDGQIVHLFTRRGWRYEEGPLEYRVYDFENGTPKLVEKKELPWARRAEDMDPKAGLVVLQTNNRSLARTWLLDLKTGKTKFLRVWPSMVDFVFVKKETAQEWIKLTRR
jgi:hypothetical protein